MSAHITSALEKIAFSPATLKDPTTEGERISKLLWRITLRAGSSRIRTDLAHLEHLQSVALTVFDAARKREEERGAASPADREDCDLKILALNAIAENYKD